MLGQCIEKPDLRFLVCSADCSAIKYKVGFKITFEKETNQFNRRASRWSVQVEFLLLFVGRVE